MNKKQLKLAYRQLTDDTEAVSVCGQILKSTNQQREFLGFPCLIKGLVCNTVFGIVQRQNLDIPPINMFI